MDVIHHEKCWVRQTRRRQISEYLFNRCSDPLPYQAESARDRIRTSATARLSPLAPVGGTMCAASPARNKRPYCMGSVTKLRIGVTLF